MWTVALSLTAGLLNTAEAGTQMIRGQVVDRNGKAVPRAVVSLTPGNVELVTDREGRFQIDYLRGPNGDKLKLEKKVSYTIAVSKLTFHTMEVAVPYKKGLFEIDPVITLFPETLSVMDIKEQLDSNVQATQREGATYIGQ